jgi:hypothetical protein
MDTIVNTVREEIKNFRCKDVVVAREGANDICNNNTKVAIKQMCISIEERKK